MEEEQNEQDALHGGLQDHHPLLVERRADEVLLVLGVRFVLVRFAELVLLHEVVEQNVERDARDEDEGERQVDPARGDDIARVDRLEADETRDDPEDVAREEPDHQVRERHAARQVLVEAVGESQALVREHTLTGEGGGEVKFATCEEYRYASARGLIR